MNLLGVILLVLGLTLIAVGAVIAVVGATGRPTGRPESPRAEGSRSPHRPQRRMTPAAHELVPSQGAVTKSLLCVEPLFGPAVRDRPGCDITAHVVRPQEICRRRSV